MLERIERTYGFKPAQHHGRDAVRTMQAIVAGQSKALMCLGGNLAVSLPDPEQCFPAMRRLDLSIHINTKLNRTQLLTGKESFILPCLGRTELDEQANGPQSVTVEDSMSMVHASRGTLPPASEHLRSEPAIIGGIARATLPKSKVPWVHLMADYDLIRDGIEAVFPEFVRFNERIRKPGGFRLPLGPTERVWNTPSGKAEFFPFVGIHEDPEATAKDALMLATLRSHDQYNTTIYGLDDRYRGVFGRRDVIFMNEDDMADRQLEHGDMVDIEALCPSTRPMRLSGFTVVVYKIARGSIGAYYPEANVLVPLDFIDALSGTPSYKSVPVRVSRSKT
jgi:molybdopterin-dependent oxidoreductase alpha subunit